MDVKIGSIVGSLKVVSEKFSINGVSHHVCECSCGVTKPFKRWTLNNSKIKSCGCKNPTRFRGECVGDLSKSYFTSFKRNRAKKGKVFSKEFTMEFLWQLFLDQDKKCAISGIDISLSKKWSSEQSGKLSISQTASIDRIDNNKDYTIDNIQWVHKDVNYMKSSMSMSRFVNICRMISINNKDKYEEFDLGDNVEDLLNRLRKN